MTKAIAQSVDKIIARGHEIVGCQKQIDDMQRAYEAGEITANEALHLLAAIIYTLSIEDMQTAH